MGHILFYLGSIGNAKSLPNARQHNAIYESRGLVDPIMMIMHIIWIILTKLNMVHLSFKPTLSLLRMRFFPDASFTLLKTWTLKWPSSNKRDCTAVLYNQCIMTTIEVITYLNLKSLWRGVEERWILKADKLVYNRIHTLHFIQQTHFYISNDKTMLSDKIYIFPSWLYFIGTRYLSIVLSDIEYISYLPLCNWLVK